MKQCYFCERKHNYPKVIIHIHHILSRTFGGTNRKGNLILMNYLNVIGILNIYAS
jgi:hypothetical protein